MECGGKAAGRDTALGWRGAPGKKVNNDFVMEECWLGVRRICFFGEFERWNLARESGVALRFPPHSMVQ